jgi:hypothetical protein
MTAAGAGAAAGAGSTDEPMTISDADLKIMLTLLGIRHEPPAPKSKEPG